MLLAAPFKTCLRDRCGPGFKTQLVSMANLDPSELQTAEKAIIEYRQRKCVQEEIEALKANKSVVMKSASYNLEPFLDPDGLLRVGGRLQQAPISTQARNPVILPKGNHVSRLIARRAHEVETGHSGNEHVLSLTRQKKYWIVRGRPLVKEKDCVTCKRLKGKLEAQRMPDLSLERVSLCRQPFM